MRLIDPKKIPKMGEPTTLEDAPRYEFAQCLVDYLVENYGVDIPNIVRCKDCKWYRENEAYCVYWASIYVNADATPRYSPVDYCFRGIRKEGAEE